MTKKSVLVIVDTEGQVLQTAIGEFDGDSIDTYLLESPILISNDEFDLMVLEYQWAGNMLIARVTDSEGFDYTIPLESIEVPTNMDEHHVDLDTWMEKLMYPVVIITRLMPMDDPMKIV
jgi:hypothetical protein